MQLDSATGRLVSLRHRAAPDQELILAGPHDPVFVIQYLDERRRFRQITSRQARAVEVRSERPGQLTAVFKQVGGFDLDVTVSVRAAEDQPLRSWTLAMRSQAGLLITDVQFPFVVAPYHLAGIYLACQDPSGLVKQIKPVHHEPGLPLGLAHIDDWPQNGERQLEYEVVLGAFTGDWYAAAEIYRGWSLQQPWAQTPLTLSSRVASSRQAVWAGPGELDRRAADRPDLGSSPRPAWRTAPGCRAG